MTHQAKRARATYALLALLIVLLPMTGWFARSASEKTNNDLPTVFRQSDLIGVRACGPLYTVSQRADHVRR
jgi:hypothetical protein